MAAKIPLRDGLFTLIDESDSQMLASYRWWLRSAGERSKDYAYTQVRGKTVYLHRMLLRPRAGFFVDHVNGDGLDNRRSNLRVCSPSENTANRAVRNKYGYRGIEPTFGGKLWRAKAQKGGVQKYASLFETKEDAARAYDEMARELFGEFAILNFPDGADDV